MEPDPLQLEQIYDILREKSITKRVSIKRKRSLSFYCSLSTLAFIRSLILISQPRIIIFITVVKMQGEGTLKVEKKADSA
jgi:hypothetical protein